MHPPLTPPSPLGNNMKVEVHGFEMGVKGGKDFLERFPVDERIDARGYLQVSFGR